MQKYSSNLIEIFYNSSYAGAISGADVIVKNENETNGEVVKTYLVVRDGLLKDCSFQAMGSIALYASLTTMCALSKGKVLSEILNTTEKDIINELKQLNKQDYGEVVFALESFKKAVLTYMKRKNLGTINERPNQKLRIIAPSKNITRYSPLASKMSDIENALKNSDEEKVVVKNEQTEPKKQEKPKQQVKQVVKPVSKQVEKSIARQEQKEADKTTSTVNRNEKKLDALISEVKLDNVEAKKVSAEEQDSELLIIPVGGKKKPKKVDKSNIVIPTKIEVRVVEEEKKNKPVAKKGNLKNKPEVKKTAKENPYLIKPENTESADDEVIDEIDSITEQLTNAISQLNFKFDDEEK